MDLVTLRSLPVEDYYRLQNSAIIAQALEDIWVQRIARDLEAYSAKLLEKLRETGKVSAPNIEQLLIEHYFDISIKSTRYAMTEVEADSNIPAGAGRKTLARFPKVKIPRSLSGLMKLYDAWRKGRYKPPRAVKQAREIQKAYLKKVSSVWEQHSEAFRKGDAYTQELVAREIQEAAKTTTSRAKTIVRTETTNYYNTARKQFYDESPDITHYLFIAIRDAATSPWCSPLTTDGYRGRSGLVYAKSDPLCDKERPACHPNCRSEYLPLNRLNPAHVKFIYDQKLQRRNHQCYPLLRGWHAA